MYVTDAAEAAAKACVSKNSKNKILNIGNGAEKISLIKLVKLINNTIGSKKFILDKNFKNTDRSANKEILEDIVHRKKLKSY